MPQPVTVYRWDDPGAPQIVEQRPSEIISLLKKCLIEGYGAKAPLGWSVLFEDVATTKIIFQNSVAAGGSGGVLLVEAGSAGNAIRANTFFTPAKSAIDINTLFQGGHRHRGHYRNASWNRWVVIGTAAAFYLIVGELGQVAAWTSVRDFTGFFGDFSSFLPNDAGRFIAYINNYSGDNGSGISNYDDNFDEVFHSIAYRQSTNAVSNTMGRLLLRNADGSEGTRLYNVLSMFGTSSIGTVPQTPGQNVGFYSPVLVTIKSGSEFISSSARDDAGQILPGSKLSPVYRGSLPGLIYEVFPRYTTQQWPVTESLQGHQHFLLRSMVAVAPLWINMEEWP